LHQVCCFADSDYGPGLPFNKASPYFHQPNIVTRTVLYSLPISFILLSAEMFLLIYSFSILKSFLPLSPYKKNNIFFISWWPVYIYF
jgi:hypothetical protein